MARELGRKLAKALVTEAYRFNGLRAFTKRKAVSKWRARNAVDIAPCFDRRATIFATHAAERG